MRFSAFESRAEDIYPNIHANSNLFSDGENDFNNLESHDETIFQEDDMLNDLANFRKIALEKNY